MCHWTSSYFNAALITLTHTQSFQVISDTFAFLCTRRNIYCKKPDCVCSTSANWFLPEDKWILCILTETTKIYLP